MYVLSLVDYTHPAATEFFQNAKVRDCATDERLGICHFARY